MYDCCGNDSRLVGGSFATALRSALRFAHENSPNFIVDYAERAWPLPLVLLIVVIIAAFVFGPLLVATGRRYYAAPKITRLQE